jgi:hypothetical protein
MKIDFLLITNTFRYWTLCLIWPLAGYPINMIWFTHFLATFKEENNNFRSNPNARWNSDRFLLYALRVKKKCGDFFLLYLMWQVQYAPKSSYCNHMLTSCLCAKMTQRLFFISFMGEFGELGRLPAKKEKTVINKCNIIMYEIWTKMGMKNIYDFM